MRFLTIYKTEERNTPPSTEEIAAMGKLIEQMVAEGTLISTEGCLPSARGARVRRRGKKISVTDGPFTESKELIAGFWIWQVKSRDEAIEWAKRAPFPAGVQLELRQIFEAPDFGEAFTPELQAKEEQLRAQSEQLSRAGAKA